MSTFEYDEKLGKAWETISRAVWQRMGYRTEDSDRKEVDYYLIRGARVFGVEVKSHKPLPEHTTFPAEIQSLLSGHRSTWINAALSGQIQLVVNIDTTRNVAYLYNAKQLAEYALKDRWPVRCKDRNGEETSLAVLVPWMHHDAGYMLKIDLRDDVIDF